MGSAALAPYAAIPLAVVGGTLGGKYLLVKKLIAKKGFVDGLKTGINGGKLTRGLPFDLPFFNDGHPESTVDIDFGFDANLERDSQVLPQLTQDISTAFHKAGQDFLKKLPNVKVDVTNKLIVDGDGNVLDVQQYDHAGFELIPYNEPEHQYEHQSSYVPDYDHEVVYYDERSGQFFDLGSIASFFAEPLEDKNLNYGGHLKIDIVEPHLVKKKVVTTKPVVVNKKFVVEEPVVEYGKVVNKKVVKTKPVVVQKKVVENLKKYGKKHKTLHHSHSGHFKFDEHVVKPVVVHKKVVVDKPVVIKKKFEVEKPVIVHKKVVVEKPVVVKKKVVVEKPVVVDSYKGQPSHYDQPDYDRELQNYPLVDEVEEDEGNDVEVSDKMDDGEIEVIEETDEDYPEQERDSQSYFHKKVHKHHGKKHKTFHHSHRHSHKFY